MLLGQEGLLPDMTSRLVAMFLLFDSQRADLPSNALVGFLADFAQVR